MQPIHLNKIYVQYITIPFEEVHGSKKSIHFFQPIDEIVEVKMSAIILREVKMKKMFHKMRYVVPVKIRWNRFNDPYYFLISFQVGALQNAYYDSSL